MNSPACVISHPCSVSVAVLHQHLSHGLSQHRKCSYGPSATTARLVSSFSIHHCFPALLWNIYIFQHCSVQQATKQKEPKENQLSCLILIQGEIFEFCFDFVRLYNCILYFVQLKNTNSEELT